MQEFESAWNEFRVRCEQALRDRLTPTDTDPLRLHEAMAYACLDGGKRFRAMLVYACGRLCGATLDQLDTPACAVEMVHAYSLIHDDLPAMDDDALRRGRASCHIQFDEATAVLAGDALQSRAFEILSSPQWNPGDAGTRLRMVEELARSIGSLGMAGGQSLDMEATGADAGFEELVRMHRMKTGALISGAARIGALAGKDPKDSVLDAVAGFGDAIGLAFQITDDVLDFTSDSHALGKPGGSDTRSDKSTYVSCLGLEEARIEAEKLCAQAIESIRCLGDNRMLLEQLARFVVDRKF